MTSVLGNKKDAHPRHDISQNCHKIFDQQNDVNVFMFKAQIYGLLWRGLGHIHEPGGELSSLFSAQVAQPVDQAQTLGPDEGGGEIFPDLSNYDSQLLIRNIAAKSPGLGSNPRLVDNKNLLSFLVIPGHLTI